MDLIVYKLIIEDRDTGTLYETGYKFDHSRIAEEVDGEVTDLGGIEEALDNGTLEEHQHAPHMVTDHTH
jgi:hypothetical protein